MKKLLFIVLLCFFYIHGGYAQESNTLEFTEVINVDGVSANELKERSLNWFAVTFNNSDKILVPSSDNQLIAKPIIEYIPSFISASDQVRGTIRYTLQIQFKDGRLRYSFFDFIHEGNPFAKFKKIDFGLITNEIEYNNKIQGTTTAWKNKTWNDIKKQIDQDISPLIESLRKSVIKQSKEDDNW